MSCTTIEDSCSLLEIDLSHLDLVSWLSAQQTYPKFYWKGKDSDLEIAAVGSIFQTDQIPQISKTAPDHICFYGARFFSPSQSEDLWKDFSPSFFFIPEFEIRQTKQCTKLLIRKIQNSFNDKQSEVLYFDCSLDTVPLEYHTRMDAPAKPRWEENIKAVTKLIQEQKIQKVVLARKTEFHFSSAPHPYSILKDIKERSLHTTLFALQTTPNSLFLGATPEMLYQRMGPTLTTEAIAGTRKRGSTLQEDRKLKEELLADPKEKREFAFVKDFLISKLSSLCSEFSYAPMDSVIQTSTVQHMYNRFQGILHSSISDEDLLKTLHPTPAIGGVPLEEALQLLGALEPFERGLYASPIGWISSREAQFAVAIRSALISGHLMHVFAGLGVVQGSDPDKEWQELEHKISQWRLFYGN